METKTPDGETQQPELTARCISGHVETLTRAQIEEARRDGVAFCSRCGNVMFVTKAKAK